jgi:hypothetical protein
MRSRRVAVGLSLIALLGACGGDDDSTSTGGATPITAAASDVSAPAGGSTDSDGALEGLQTFEIPPPKHTDDPVTYAQTPPVGGNHFPGWLNCGAYAEPQPNEQAVHSMEHGAVWVTYDPALPDADVTALRALTANQSHLLVTPYPGLASKVVASAWGVQVSLDGVADPRLKTFIETYQNGPQTLEPGAPCSGALGTPL